MIKEFLKILRCSVARGLNEVKHHPMYWGCMVFVPLFAAVFFVTLLSGGVADNVPSAVVDLDKTSASRSVVRTLDSFQSVDVQYQLNSYTEAMDYIRQGKILGFVIIPEGFSRDMLSQRKPELSYYINFSCITPASLMLKGYTTVSLLSNAGVMHGTLSAMGMDDNAINSMLQPYVTHMHSLGNPWLDYGLYLSNSFGTTVLALMVMILTAYSLTIEIKNRTSVEWLQSAGGSMWMAVLGKLLPQTLIFFLAGWGMQLIFYGFAGYPLNCLMWQMLLAVFMLVVASQGFALLVSCLIVNPRMALSMCCISGVLAFSIAGLSFPVEQMYSWVGILSWILPSRYYFIIYCNQALNGLEFAYSAPYYAAMLLFVIAPAFLLWNMKRKCLHPVYVP
ncbi:MAG: ABC transporter permease [Muribaculaceae bacterium]